MAAGATAKTLEPFQFSELMVKKAAMRLGVIKTTAPQVLP
jgi:hypothetical protein